jgi:transposase
MKKYLIKLSREERDTLKKIITSGRGPARMFTRARILLKADQGGHGPNWSDEQISDALDVTVQTIERVRKQFVEEGFDAVLSRRQYTQKVSRKKIDGNVEAHLIALSCSEPPKGYVRWTLRLLADKIVELGYVETISHEAIRQTLKKTNLSRG